MSAKVEVHDIAVIMHRVDCEYFCKIGPDNNCFFSDLEATNRAEEHRKKHNCPNLPEGEYHHDEDFECDDPRCMDGELMVTIDEP